MAVILEPDEMSHDELVEAHRKYDNTPVKKKLYEKHRYSPKQLVAISKGIYKPDQGDKWSEVEKL